MKLVLFLIIIVLVVNTIVATIMGKKEDLRAAKRAAKAKLSPKPKDKQPPDRARAAQRASKPPPKAKDQRARNSARALERAENLEQQLAQVLPTSSVATPAITPAAAAATAPPSITSPWQLGNKVECDFPGDKTCTVIIQSIGISTTNSAEEWLEDTADPSVGESFTVLLSALRPVGWFVDPEYEASMARSLLEELFASFHMAVVGSG